MTNKEKLPDMSRMSDEDLEAFWENHEPENFATLEESNIVFRRPAKKLIQLRLDPRDVRVIDRESKRSGIDRAQLVRSWVKEKLADLKQKQDGFRK